MEGPGELVRGSDAGGDNRPRSGSLQPRSESGQAGGQTAGRGERRPAMKLTWHIVKKDFQRLWVPLALWSLLLAAKVAIGWTMLEGSSVTLGWSANAEQMWLNRMTLYSNLLIALDILVNYVLAGVLIHEDALLGTQLFWRTRPISGARLLGAKLLGAALMFGAVPVLVWLPWWLHCSYGRAQIASAVIEVLFWQMLITLPALLMAALTDQFGRFL